MMNPKIRLTGSNSTRNNNMNKYLLAGIVGCALGALVSVKLAGPVLAQDAETKKTIYTCNALGVHPLHFIAPIYIRELHKTE